MLPSEKKPTCSLHSRSLVGLYNSIKALCAHHQHFRVHAGGSVPSISAVVSTVGVLCPLSAWWCTCSGCLLSISTVVSILAMLIHPSIVMDEPQVAYLAKSSILGVGNIKTNETDYLHCLQRQAPCQGMSVTVPGILCGWAL